MAQPRTRKQAHQPATVRALHKPTKAAATGLGKVVATSFKVAPGKRGIWNPAVVNDGVLPWLAASAVDGRGSHENKLGATVGASAVDGAAPPPRPLVELHRWAEAHKLRSLLKQLCRHAGLATHPTLSFERWLCRAKLAEAQGGESPPPSVVAEPLLPLLPRAEPGLVGDLERAGLQHDAAAGIALQLAQASIAAAGRVAACGKHGGTVTGPKAQRGKQRKRGKRRPAEPQVRVARHKHTMDVTLVGGQLPKHLFKLNPVHWAKLAALFARTRGGGEAAGHDVQAACEDEASSLPAAVEFRSRVFTLLARYHALQGPGFQAAVVEHAFGVLHDAMGVSLECFASPLNCHFARFCSAFPDTDACFGSAGSFFDSHPLRGSFQANPPFIDTLMLAMARHIHRLLSNAATGQLTKAQRAALAVAGAGAGAGAGGGSSTAGRGDAVGNGPRALSFVVVVPGWTEDPGWQLLRKSRFKRAEWLIARDDHGFCDGAQHQRRDR